MPKYIFLLLGVFIIQSCQNSKIMTDNTDNNDSFQLLYASEYGGSGEEQVTIMDERSVFAKQWVEITTQPSLSAPKFNPDTQMIIRKDFESRRTGGDEFEVNAVEIIGNKINVFYTVSHPGEYATDAITSPILLILVNKIDDPVIEFIHQQ